MDGRLDAYGRLMVGADGDIELLDGWEEVAQGLIISLRSHRLDYRLHPELCADLEDFMGEWLTPELLERLARQVSDRLNQAMPVYPPFAAPAQVNVEVQETGDQSVLILVQLVDESDQTHLLVVPFSYLEGLALPADLNMEAGSLVEAYLV